VSLARAAVIGQASPLCVQDCEFTASEVAQARALGYEYASQSSELAARLTLDEDRREAIIYRRQDFPDGVHDIYFGAQPA
jgi:hypothetical protein